jgi:hypothetical protein
MKINIGNVGKTQGKGYATSILHLTRSVFQYHNLTNYFLKHEPPKEILCNLSSTIKLLFWLTVSGVFFCRLFNEAAIAQDYTSFNGKIITEGSKRW